MIDIREHGGMYAEGGGGKDDGGSIGDGDVTGGLPIDFGDFPVIRNISGSDIKKGDKVGFYIGFEKFPLPPNGVAGISFDGKYLVTKYADIYKISNGQYKKLPRYLTSPYDLNDECQSASFSKDNKYLVITIAPFLSSSSQRITLKRDEGNDSFKEIDSGDRKSAYGSFVNSSKYNNLYLEDEAILEIKGDSVIEHQNNHTSTYYFDYQGISGNWLAQELMSSGEDSYTFYGRDQYGKGSSKYEVTIDLKNKKVDGKFGMGNTAGSNIRKNGDAHKFLSIGYRFHSSPSKNPLFHTMQDFFESAKSKQSLGRFSTEKIYTTNYYNTNVNQTGRQYSGGFDIMVVKGKRLVFSRNYSSGNDETFLNNTLLIGSSDINLLELFISSEGIPVIEEGLLSNSSHPRSINYYGILEELGFSPVLNVRPVSDYLNPKNYGMLPGFVVEIKTSVKAGQIVYN